ncbi:MAG: HEPN domain-containing protein, partial [Ignavibacteria bacterium]|nr:HEPN domain-containing protein [Ignavibacteria bacterium]
MVTKAEWKIREKGAHQYLKIALDDLEHAKLSLNNKHYRQAVEASQQGVEKTLKGYAIYLGILTESDFFSPDRDERLIGRGHDSFKIFKRMYEIQNEKI